MTSASLTRTAQPGLTDRQVYRLLFAATYAFFLVSTIAKRLVRVVAGEGAPGRSILAEARQTTSSTLHIAFMG